MKKSVNLVAAVLVALSVSSCKTLSTDALQGDWDVVNIAGEQVTPSENTPFLGFNMVEGSLYGSDGCNNLMGGLDLRTLSKGKIDFSKVASTMMMCPDNQYEAKFKEAMAKSEKISLENGSLILKDKAGEAVMTLSKRVFEANTYFKGTWDVVMIKGESVTPEEGKTPYLTFTPGKEANLSGFSGCNKIFGTVDLDKMIQGTPDFAGLGMTRMACAEDLYESKLMQAIAEATKVKAEYGSFSLLNDEGHILVRFNKR